MVLNIEKYLTPYKLDRPLLAGSGKDGDYNSHAVDVPFAFFHNGRTYLMHVGNDGVGYQTALSSADSPASSFRLEGVILKRGFGHGWDNLNAAGTWILCEDDINKVRTLKKYKGKYWMTYHAYPETGYETGPASIGLAYCEDESLLNWTRIKTPVLTPHPEHEWEAGGLYKSCIVCHDNIFYMFYNAKNKVESWHEQIGVATSPDLIHWERSDRNPLVKVTPNSFDSIYASDPCVVLDNDLWVMFYYGYNSINAVNSLAFSHDLLSWEKAGIPVLNIGTPGELDSLHAHKPSIYFYKGVLYHYYCACRPATESDAARGCFGEYRCLAVAANKPW